jgi:hypothetical protein
MRPAEGKPDVTAIGQLTGAGKAIDLQNALEALEVGDRPLGFAVGCVDIGNTRWVGPTPGTVIGSISSKLTGLGTAAAGIEDGRGGLVREQPRQLLQPHEEALMQRAQVPGGMADPVRQRRAIQVDALAAVNLGLAIQRQMVGIFGHQNLGDGSLGCRPPSISRTGAGACTRPSSQVRQAYLGRRVTSTRNCAGTMSSRSLLSSPIRCNSPWQHGQVLLSMSTTISIRGRCPGSARRLIWRL